MRTVSKGSADKSYGNYVARLAGLPQEILKNSKNILNKLEKRHNIIQKTQGIGQLSLFDNTTEEVEEKIDYEQKYFELRSMIDNIDVNNLTPIQALNELNELKNNIGDEKNDGE